MAKKPKSLNPADAFRKAQRQKEIKRNKLDRKKARKDAHSKKDSSAIQAEINQLERLSKPTPSEQTRLKDAKHELSLILKAKEQKGIAVSDENRSTPKVIIDPATGLPAVSSTENGNDADKAVINTSSHPPRFGPNSRTMNWFGPDGKLLEPEKSFYYHPVFNPFGVPPPGMPMRMKETSTLPSGTSPSEPQAASAIDNGAKELGQIQPPPTELTETEDLSEKEGDSEDDSEEDESEEDSENDIPLPEGSPPGSESENDEDDDEEEIPLPDGPPPPKPVQKPRSEQLINRPTKTIESIRFQGHPPHSGLVQPAPFFPPPISLVPGFPPPPMIAGMSMITFPLGPNGLPLPPPPVHNFHSLPLPPSSANLPAKPDLTTGPLKGASASGAATATSKPTIQASATLTALPQLRDLKREATSFVPAAIRKKRKELDRRAGLAGLGDGNRIQAAPSSLDSVNGDQSDPKEPKQVTTSLLAALKRDGVVSDNSAFKAPVGSTGAEKDDYDKFVESLGGVL
ncbi:hypothetical protein Pst134EA_016037 [Puccinia striiformis f. sp. tritici]|uniref:hypothetical protein n=1 Tax=Puccinia striiformis f. sp. tritici TaxID=168172 RepID=UPI00200874D0|nr:hypothetical protein Pst134EA_016037 [Puccinia striiformis f. sp. tritici]KAH9463958.1 hypothetical protein Pst134EA_016037 [Puccinia striiformis f. sp. tritici]